MMGCGFGVMGTLLWCGSDIRVVSGGVEPFVPRVRRHAGTQGNGWAGNLAARSAATFMPFLMPRVKARGLSPEANMIRPLRGHRFA